MDQLEDKSNSKVDLPVLPTLATNRLTTPKQDSDYIIPRNLKDTPTAVKTELKRYEQAILNETKSTKIHDKLASQFKKELNFRFSEKEEPVSARPELQSLRQLETESLPDFAQRIQTLAMDGYSDANSKIRNDFWKRIQNQFRTH
ncbi:hypothetical protein LOTGIDRAFT_173656 [Lottia gigantea]|uniref:Uncharacterized protein n=1 Tax=Lottia gigantea TaxID=225164 RepID=V4AQX4_LOTGI|nr:hypothetical protein LOTGIDRAFT_173656 [Lottia gigantea]ESO99647.1 hypothetical protein LOTGIDRAFT_173656 [Lottia gigantea]